VGILVTEIDHGSAAAYSDLKIGDAVLSINDQVPSSPKDAVKLILEDKGQPVKFVIISSKEV
jgi:S1-C subfamily serine protease